MKNGENFNSAPDTNKSFEDAYGSWDTLQEELVQQKQAKAEADAAKKREMDLAKGAKKFDKSVRDAIHKGDKVAFDEMMERDEHYRRMEMGENQIEEEPYEASTLSKEEFAQAVKSSDEIQKMDLLVRRMQNSTSEEAKAKFRQELIQLSNEFSKGEGAIAVKDWHDQAQWDFRKASESEGFRQKVLDTIWENAMTEPEVKKSNPDDGVKNEALNNGDDAEKQKPEVTELLDAENKFNELLSKGASAEELARFRREVRSKLIQKDELTPENKEMLERMLETSLKVGDQERELNKANSSIDTDSNIEEKAGRFQKIKKFIGSRVMKWGALGMLGITLGGIGSKIVYDWLSSDDNSPQTEQTFSGTVHADSLNEAANFNSDGSVVESEKNFNNGKYDSENDDYNKIDQKENKYSIGTDISKLSNEEYQKKMIESHNEDDIEYMGQFFVNDAESARNLLGISNNEVDDLVDAARNGDQTAFQKLNDAYSKYMEGAKVVGNQTLDGDYYSLFVNSNKDYAHAEGAFGGTARIVELKNGQQILIRDQCKQMVMKKIAEVPNTWTTPVIPFEEACTPPAPNTENPPAPTPETPPETPPTPETPPEKHDDTKFKTDQSIYNIDNAVTKMDKGELIGEASQEERNNNINPEATPRTATGRIKAEGVGQSIDVSKIGEQPAGYTGETTAEAQAQAAEQAEQAQVETEAKAREAEQAQNKTVNIGGETVNYNNVWAAQQNYNQTYGASAATNQNNTQQ